MDAGLIFHSSHMVSSIEYMNNLKHLAKTGVLGRYVPEIERCYGFNQRNPMHSYDVWQHTLMAIAYADSSADYLHSQGIPVNIQEYLPIVRLTMFFHDIGKPNTYVLKDGKGTFYGHAEEGAKITRHVLNRLELYNKPIRDRITLYVERHMTLLGLFNAQDKTILKFINAVGVENLPYFIGISYCDLQGSGVADKVQENMILLNGLVQRIKLLLADKPTEPQLKLAINGHDLAKWGLKGKQIGIMLRLLEEKVKRNGLLNNATTLEIHVKNLMLFKGWERDAPLTQSHKESLASKFK